MGELLGPSAIHDGLPLHPPTPGTFPAEKTLYPVLPIPRSAILSNGPNQVQEQQLATPSPAPSHWQRIQAESGEQLQHKIRW